MEALLDIYTTLDSCFVVVLFSEGQNCFYVNICRSILQKTVTNIEFVAEKTSNQSIVCIHLNFARPRAIWAHEKDFNEFLEH